MKRIRRGWELTKKSWGVLRQNRQLIRFPLYGAVATIPLAVITLGPGFYLIEEGEIAPGAPLAVLGLFVLAIVGVFFSVGLAATADRIFRGEEASVGDGLAVARERFAQVVGWAAFSTVVGVILSVIEDQGGPLGQIAGRLLGVGWALVTFLAVPVIAIEGAGPIETLQRSGSLFKSRWGQQLAGNLAIGGAAVLFGVLPGVGLVVLGILLWSTTGFGGAALLFAGILLIAVAVLVQKALSGIFGVALYRYAADGATLGGFTEEELNSAVKPRRGSLAPSTV